MIGLPVYGDDAFRFAQIGADMAIGVLRGFGKQERKKSGTRVGDSYPRKKRLADSYQLSAKEKAEKQMQRASASGLWRLARDR